MARTPHSTELTVAFADLAGFAALTEAHGDEEAAALIDRFCTLSREALEPDDRLIKSIGGCGHVELDGSRRRLAFGRSGIGIARPAAELPVPRSGLHHGPRFSGGELVAALENLGISVGNAVVDRWFGDFIIGVGRKMDVTAPRHGDRAPNGH
jgi:hypothetical protein